ncbi:MAG: hypothetical protein CMO81_04130 [Waddliaceae bacterium]|nr:hypothetical protein [Waddliaceae bacterium]
MNVFLAVKRKFLSLVLLIGIASLLSSFTHSNQGVSIDFPDDWGLEKKSPLSLILIESPKRDENNRPEATVDLTVDTLSNDINVNKVLLGTIYRILQSYENLDSFEFIRHEDSDQDLERFDLSYPILLEGMGLQAQVYSVRKGDKLCTLTCIAQEDFFYDYSKLFADMAASIRIETTEK